MRLVKCTTTNKTTAVMYFNSLKSIYIYNKN